MSDVNFDAEFLKKLELLRILSKRLMKDRNRGERRFITKGTSVEFKDYRDYTPGDDTRYIDWNIFQRLDRLLIKLFEEEVEHIVYCLIDGSASMGFGDPTKLAQAKMISAALSYIALCNQDRVSVGVFRQGVDDQLPPVHGKAQIWSVFKFLERLKAQDSTAVSLSCRNFAHRTKRRGIAVLLSDFLDPVGIEEGLKQFVYRKYDLYLVHLVSPEDYEPRMKGELTLVDSETGEERPLTVDDETLKLYRRTYDNWIAEIEEYCRVRQITYIQSSTEVPFDDVVLRLFREGRILHS